MIKTKKIKCYSLERVKTMTKKVTEQIGKTVEEAIRKGLEELKVSRDDVKIEVLEEPSNGGVLGILSAKLAKVRLTVDKKISEEKIAPVLLLTAFSQPEIVEQAKDSGVLGYLVKPVQESNLFPAIEIALSRWQEMQGLEAELDKLKDSLETRKIVARAKGIIMAAHKLGEQEAYRRIQRYAMTKRISIKDVAEAIVKAAGGKV